MPQVQYISFDSGLPSLQGDEPVNLFTTNPWISRIRLQPAGQPLQEEMVHGQQGGSPGKGSLVPEFGPRNPHGGRREQTPES